MPRNIFEEMKYLEVMIVSDHSMYKRYKTKQHMRNYAKSVVNLVDAIFKEHLHTRVVLVAVEIWTDRDQIPISVRPLEMLKDFSKYRQLSIKQHADAVHLFTNVTFHYRRSSAAYSGGLCSDSRGVGVNEYGTTWTMAVTLSQSLAQNLGIQWDPPSKRSIAQHTSSSPSTDLSQTLPSFVDPPITTTVASLVVIGGSRKEGGV